MSILIDLIQVMTLLPIKLYLLLRWMFSTLSLQGVSFALTVAMLSYILLRGLSLVCSLLGFSG